MSGASCALIRELRSVGEPVTGAVLLAFLTNVQHSGVKAVGFHNTAITVQNVVVAVTAQVHVDALNDSTVLQGQKQGTGGTGRITQLTHEVHVSGLEAAYANRTQARREENGTDGVRAVEYGGHVVAPVIALTVCNAGPNGGAVVQILALSLHQLTDIALLVANHHLKGGVEVAVVLGVGVNLTGLFYSLDQFNRFLHGSAGQALAHYVTAALQNTNGIGSVLVCVVCQNNRIHIVLDEFVEILIQSNLQTLGLCHLAGSVQRRTILIADSNQFCLSVSTGQNLTDHGLTTAGTKHTNLNFSHCENLLKIIFVPTIYARARAIYSTWEVYTAFCLYSFIIHGEIANVYGKNQL